MSDNSEIESTGQISDDDGILDINLDQINEYSSEIGEELPDLPPVLEEADAIPNDEGEVFRATGTAWRLLRASQVGRAGRANIFRGRPGISKAVENEAAKSPYNAWKLLISERILRIVQHCTTISGNNNH